MTKEALQEQHKMIMALTTKSSTDATNLSIQYAIEVLEELKDGYQFMAADGVTGIPRGSIVRKITELKSLLK